MRVVCLSDTHEYHKSISVPDGDLLIVSGDFTHRGARDAVKAFNSWLGTLPHKHKVVIAGNHELTFDPKKKVYEPGIQSDLTNCTYLEDSWHVVEGFVVYGSPWTPEFYNWAFQLKGRGQAIETWDKVPETADIVVTHGPARGILDQCPDGRQVGCLELATRLLAVEPRLHVFGHIHHSYGTMHNGRTIHVNAASCDERYMPLNPPIVVDI